MSPPPPHRVLLVFVDGVGLAPAAASNPLATVPTPALDDLLGGSLTAERLGANAEPLRRDGLLLAPLDARLGVDGLPQSATGQTALFTGVNAAAELGHHVTAFPGPRLRAILQEHSLLKRAVDRGLAATFANPFTRSYFERVERQRHRGHSATTWAALAAGLELRGPDDLAAGRAVAWDVVRDRFRSALADDEGPVPAVTAERAGRDLAGLAGEHHVTLYETFLTDLAGHGRFGITAEEAIRRVDGLLAGVLAARPPEVTVLLTSDHGNVEAGEHTRHTLNPVPLLAVGPAAERFAGLGSILGVAGRVLGVVTGGAGGPARGTLRF